MNTKPLTQAQRKRLGYYAWAGPLFGLATVNIAFLIGFLFQDVTSNNLHDFTLKDLYQFLAVWGAINIYGVFICYVIGLLPAVITGVIAVRCKRKKDEVICASLIGASPYISLYLIGVILEGLNSGWNAWLAIAPIGAIAGAFCACTKRSAITTDTITTSLTQQPT